MNKDKNNNEVEKLLKTLSSPLKKQISEAAIILAAGHGKRIKSQRSKMLHKIWEVPTVERVYDACAKGLKNAVNVIVVGIKAADVMQVIGKRENTVFAYQKEQNGTGHAVQVALKTLGNISANGTVYVFPGDMGLLDSETVRVFRKKFVKSGCDMMVLVGVFEGKPEENYYGRIIRVKDKDINGNPSGNEKGNVIGIIEFKDIIALPEKSDYRITYKGKVYSYSKDELISLREYNSGVYAFRFNPLKKLIRLLKSNNVQNEIYITDMIYLFNQHGYSVKAVSPEKQYVVMGFNNKSVLKEMESIKRKQIYNKLKDIIEIEDPDDFFIHEEVVEQLFRMDKKNIPLDITIGKGVYIGKGARLNYNLELKKNVFIHGNVHFGKNVTVYHNVHLSTFPHQVFKIGDDVTILWGDIIKGNIRIGKGTRIESSVNMTGSDEYPIRIGENVLIKGTSYLFGSIVESGVVIEHSVLKMKRIRKKVAKDDTVMSVRYFIPNAEGTDLIEVLK
ncbi:MAG: bifunctional UDP-N-acetylglucosamine diphosphorylase/glucosamine-1-phosphate N-acetyltransferase GlmU [Ignavibacteriaceae bacterium]